MEKDSVVELLSKAGYTAQNQNGVVMVFYTDLAEYAEFVEKIREFLSDAGYKGSWGCRHSKDAQTARQPSVEEFKDC